MSILGQAPGIHMGPLLIKRMNNSPTRSIFIVSACLMGLCTRYDGIIKPDTESKIFLKDSIWIPVCPEQLGGLPTPRTAADLISGDGMDILKGQSLVINRDGVDVSREFIAGARAVLRIAQAQNIRLAMLKAKSPSCGLTPMLGVTAALLLAHDIRIIEF